MNPLNSILIFSLLKEVNQLIKQIKSKNNSSSKSKVNYLSSQLKSIQLSIEILFEFLKDKINKEKYMKYKWILVFLMEIAITFFKIKEYKDLQSQGFNFYINKDIYNNVILINNLYDNILIEKDQEDSNKPKNILINNINNINNTESLRINSKKQDFFFGKEINNRILSKIHISDEVNQKLISSKMEINKESTKDCLNSNGNSQSIVNISHSKSNFNEENSEESNEILKFLLKNMRETENIKEIIYLIKPLFYLILLGKYSRTSSFPTLILFLIDLLLKGKNFNRVEGTFTQKYIFSLEQLSRSSSYLLYLIRYPFVSYLTVPFIRFVLGVFRLSDGFKESLCDGVSNAYLQYLIN